MKIKGELKDWTIAPIEVTANEYKRFMREIHVFLNNEERIYIPSARFCLEGEVFGSKDHPDGEYIRTSCLKTIEKENERYFINNNIYAITKTGSCYLLNLMSKSETMRRIFSDLENS